MLSRRFLLKTAALTSVAAGGRALAQTSNGPVAIRYAVLGIAGQTLPSSYMYFAVKKGIYLKHGVDLQLTSFPRGGPEAVAGAASGQVDLGDLGTPILSAISTGIPIKVVGAPPFKAQPFVLVSRPDIQTIADLKGQVVSVGSIGGGAEQALAFILKAHGLGPTDVKEIAVGTTNGDYAALKIKRIAAAVMNEPQISESIHDGVGKVLAKAVDYYGRYEHSYVFASKQFIAQNPDAISAFFIANREAIDYAKTHKEEIVAYAASTSGLDPAVVNQYFSTYLPLWDDRQQVDIPGMLTAIKYLKEFGYINKNYKPDLAQILDLRFNGQQRA